MNTKEMIGARIREIRNTKGMTQERLSELMNINPKYLSSIERGLENPTLNTVLKLSDSLDVGLGDIFTNIEVEDPKKQKALINALLKRATDEQLKLAFKILSVIIK